MIEGRRLLSDKQRLDPTDEVLLRVAVARPNSDAGRQAAFDLLGRYSARVLKWCRRYARDEDEAMDLAQQALMRAYDRLETFEGRARFSSWLFAVARSTCLNAVKRVDFLRDPELELESLADAGPNPEQELERIQDHQERLRVMGEILDPQEQEAMVLRYVEHLSPEEITRALGLESRSGARGLLQRARRKLAAALARPDEEKPHGT